MSERMSDKKWEQLTDPEAGGWSDAEITTLLHEARRARDSEACLTKERDEARAELEAWKAARGEPVLFSEREMIARRDLDGLRARAQQRATFLDIVLRERDEALEKVAELSGKIGELRMAAVQASAELRHTYRPCTRDWNLVARAIEILEMATTTKHTAGEGQQKEST